MRYRLLNLFLFVLWYGNAQFALTDIGGAGLQENGLDRQPEFFNMPWEYGTKLVKKETSMFIEVDSIGKQNIGVLVDQKERPRLYVSDIETPVCADGDCKLMNIRLYWTLLGDYAGFDRDSKLPLTKNDHDEFSMADYLKLHLLLTDANSILKQRKIDELIEKPKPSEGDGPDALSGATIKEVKETVVSGALYSCYVAWHLVHGQLNAELREYTSSQVTDETVFQMLYSANSNYQMFALGRFDEANYEEHYARIADIFETGIPMVRGFICKNLPEKFWKTPKLQNLFWNAFADVDINTRSLLLEHLNSASTETLEGISTQLGVMTKNQLKIYLEQIGKNGLVDPIRKNLVVFANAEKQTYSYIVNQFLEEYEL